MNHALDFLHEVIFRFAHGCGWCEKKCFIDLVSPLTNSGAPCKNTGASKYTDPPGFSTRHISESAFPYSEAESRYPSRGQCSIVWIPTTISKKSSLQGIWWTSPAIERTEFFPLLPVLGSSPNHLPPAVSITVLANEVSPHPISRIFFPVTFLRWYSIDAITHERSLVPIGTTHRGGNIRYLGQLLQGTSKISPLIIGEKPFHSELSIWGSIFK